MWPARADPIPWTSRVHSQRVQETALEAPVLVQVAPPKAGETRPKRPKKVAAKRLVNEVLGAELRRGFLISRENMASSSAETDCEMGMGG